MSAFSALDTLLDQYDGKNTDLLVRISEDWLPSQGNRFVYDAGSIRWQQQGLRKRSLVHRRPSVSEGSPGQATQIRNGMGDSNSGVVLGSRLLDTDRADN